MYSHIPDVDDWVSTYCRVDFDDKNPWRQLIPESERVPMTRSDIIAAIREKFGDEAARSVSIAVH